MRSIQEELIDLGVKQQALDDYIQLLYSHWKNSSTAEALEDLSGTNSQPFALLDPAETLLIKFVGREECAILENTIEEEYSKWSRGNARNATCIFLKGQPGIGMSFYYHTTKWQDTYYR